MKINNLSLINYKPIRQSKNKQNIEPQIPSVINNFDNLKCPGLLYFTSVKKNKQIINPEVYFIKMKTYGKDYEWAKRMVKHTYEISDFIKQKLPFTIILMQAYHGVKDAYKDSPKYTAEIRTKTSLNPFLMKSEGRGEEYYYKYIQKCPDDSQESWSPKANEEYKNASVNKISWYNNTLHIKVTEGWNADSQNMIFAAQEYEKLINSENSSEDEINKAVATINWLFSQEAPFRRGTDSITNLITKSIYHAYDMQISPLKTGVSLDFEAWYRDLDDYIKIYPDCFETRPHKIKKPQ